MMCFLLFEENLEVEELRKLTKQNLVEFFQVNQINQESKIDILISSDSLNRHSSCPSPRVERSSPFTFTRPI